MAKKAVLTITSDPAEKVGRQGRSGSTPPAKLSEQPADSRKEQGS
jgi:hypothetical protein